MSFNEVLAELPSLSTEQRQLLMRRALELDDFPLSPADERLVQERSAEYHANPSVRGISLEEMERRLRAARGS
jgi:hypothetical protein